MLRRIARYPLLVVIVGLLVTGVVPGVNGRVRASNELDQKLQQLQELQRKIDEAQKALERNKANQKQVLAELWRLEQNMEQTKKELDNVSSQLDVAVAEVKQAEQRLADTEDKLNKQQQLLAARLPAIYKLGPVSYLEVLLSSTTFSDLVSRMTLVSSLVRCDRELISSLEEKQKEHAAALADLQQKKARLESLKSTYEGRKVQLASRSQERERYLKNLKEDSLEWEKALDEWEELSQKLGEEIRALQQKEGFVRTGKLAMVWPVRGRVTSQYGSRYHPIIKRYRMHSGIDIAVPTGTPICAAESGVVIHSGLLGGYGYALVIDHGDGVSTLYGHCSALLVGSGKVVQKGQVIARAGNTGLSTGPHLHFEVRVNGSPVDPMRYLP